MVKWEYFIVVLTDKNVNTIEKIFNDCGGYGWELIAISDTGLAFFKRPLNNEQFITSGGISLREEPEEDIPDTKTTYFEDKSVKAKFF